MSIQDLVMKNRSYRRFYQNQSISYEQLKSWINLARLSPSARNLQTLKYKIVNTPELCQEVFPLLKWAGYLEDWDGPIEGERPSAYIVILNDDQLSTQYFCDDGIASQSILLGAVDAGFGGCIIAAVNRPKLKELLNIDNNYKIIHILALGKPKEEVVIEPIAKDGSIKYWRDQMQKHHVPKRNLDDIII